MRVLIRTWLISIGSGVAGRDMRVGSSHVRAPVSRFHQYMAPDAGSVATVHSAPIPAAPRAAPQLVDGGGGGADDEATGSETRSAAHAAAATAARPP